MRNSVARLYYNKVNLVKTKFRYRLQTNTVNGLLLSAQHISLETNCTVFKPTQKMINCMTSAQLYKKTEVEQHQGEASSDDDVNFEFDELFEAE